MLLNIYKMIPENNYVCYIGRPSYQKNTFFLVDVVKGVHEVCPDLKFILLGVGYYSPDLERLKGMIREYGLDDVIELLPWLSHEETLAYVRGALFYLTVSRYEGLPLAVIEAMSLGKAIIASDVLGNKDCVRNGYNGYLLPLEEKVFIDKVIELSKDEQKRKLFADNSRKLFLSDFYIVNRIKYLEDIYSNS